jgi:hypothetical protein
MRNPPWSRHTSRSVPQEVLIHLKVGAIDAPLMLLPG